MRLDAVLTAMLGLIIAVPLRRRISAGRLHPFGVMRVNGMTKLESTIMDTITKATGVGTDPKLQMHLAEMEAAAPAPDAIPIPLNDADLARQTHLQSLKDELAELQTRLGDIKAKVSKAGYQAADVVRTGAQWADASAHEQLGAYPWAKLAAATAATFIGTRLLRMLPLGGIVSIAAPLIIAQIKARSDRT